MRSWELPEKVGKTVLNRNETEKFEQAQNEILKCLNKVSETQNLSFVKPDWQFSRHKNSKDFWIGNGSSWTMLQQKRTSCTE